MVTCVSVCVCVFKCVRVCVCVCGNVLVPPSVPEVRAEASGTGS